MQVRTKQPGKGGRPRKFDESEALTAMQARFWAFGFSATSLDAVGRAAGINRPSLAAAFGNKEDVYAAAARLYAQRMEEGLTRALAEPDRKTALLAAFDFAVEVYTADGGLGCFILSTAPAEIHSAPLFRSILQEALAATDEIFRRRLATETEGADDTFARTAGVLAAALLHDIGLRARAGASPEDLREQARRCVELICASPTER